MFDPSLRKKKAKKQLELSELDALDAPAAPVESEKAAAGVAEPPSASAVADTVEKVADEPEDLGFGDLKKKKKKKALPLDFELVSRARGPGRSAGGSKQGCWGEDSDSGSIKYMRDALGLLYIAGASRSSRRRASGRSDVECVTRAGRAQLPASTKRRSLLWRTTLLGESAGTDHVYVMPGWDAPGDTGRDGRRRAAGAGLGRQRGQGRSRGCRRRPRLRHDEEEEEVEEGRLRPRGVREGDCR